MSFKCTMCGSCCKYLKKSDVYKDLDRGDGICKFLLDDNKCSVYDSRPLLCRVDESYEHYFKEIFDLETYYRLNKESCKTLKK